LKTPDAAAFDQPAVAENAAPDGMQRAQSYSTLKSSGLGYSLGGPAGTICKPKALFEKLVVQTLPAWHSAFGWLRGGELIMSCARAIVRRSANIRL
jgi:hypothetical protein